MIKICNSNLEVEARIELDFRLFGNLAETNFDKNMFQVARGIFSTGRNVLAVKNGNTDNSDILFYLICEQDSLPLPQNGIWFYHTNFEGCNLIEERANLDMGILKGADIFIFQQLDEYSWSIAELIKTTYSDKEVYFCDKWVNLLDPTIYMDIGSIYHHDLMAGKCMYVVSDEKAEKLEVSGMAIGKCHILNLMKYLCWARKRSCYGNLNRDKTILLIDFEIFNNGMGDIVKVVNLFATIAWDRGWYPVANIHDGQYIDHEADNVWDYYFEPLSNISVEEAKESYCVISLRENNLELGHVPTTPLFTRRIGVFDSRIALKSSLIQKFESNLRGMSPTWGGKLLGVAARGSDCARGNITEEMINFVVATCKKALNEKYDAIFLATEEERYYRALTQAVPEERLLSVQQKRVDYDYKNKPYKQIAELLDIPIGERQAWGEKYLFITYCLSKCKDIYYTIETGAIWLAKRWKANRGEQFEYINQIGSRQELIIREMIKYTTFMQSHEKVFVWGVGYLANRMENFFQGYMDKLIFCDRKAENEEMGFLGKKVEPVKKIRESQESTMGVFIMAADYASEIEKELLSWNIDLKNIMKVNRIIAPELGGL